MLAWIWSNKEWLFSGVGIVFVAGVIAVFRRRSIIFWNKFLRGGVAARRPSDEAIHLGAGEVLQVVFSKPPVPQEWAPIPSDPERIIKAIDQAPLLQRPDVEKHYRGVSVEWEGRLISATRSGASTVRLQLASGGRIAFVAISFEVDSSAYAGLGLLKSEDLIRVAGKIDGIVGAVIHLAEARLLKYGSITV